MCNIKNMENDKQKQIMYTKISSNNAKNILILNIVGKHQTKT